MLQKLEELQASRNQPSQLPVSWFSILSLPTTYPDKGSLSMAPVIPGLEGFMQHGRDRDHHHSELRDCPPSTKAHPQFDKLSQGWILSLPGAS